MSIKTAVKDHFSYSPISRHLKNHFDYLHGFNGMKLAYQDENLLMRKFTVQDVDKCAELFKEVFSAYPWYDNWVSFEQARTYLIELIENPVFEGYVAYDGLNLVAVCFGHAKIFNFCGYEIENFVNTRSPGGWEKNFS